MKINNQLLSIALVFITFISCHKTDDSTYFNGEIKEIQEKVKNESNVVLTPVPLEGTNHGFFSVNDSLMFFMNPKLPDRIFNVFNVDTGEEIGTFHNKGLGPNEFIALSPILQFYREDNDLKTLLFAPNENKLIVWNINKSILQSKTVIDTIISYKCSEETNEADFKYIFRLNKDTLLISVQSTILNEREATLPYYQKRTIYSNELLNDYSIYKQSIKNDESDIIPKSFFYSNEAFHPNGSKVVQAMLNLPQLNILDTKTGEVTGYRMKGSPHLSVFETKNKIFIDYYLRVQADEKYIYASYWGKKPWDIKEIPFINTIHVYNWQGNLIHKITTDRTIGEMALDRARNRLYTMDIGTDDVYYLDLEGLID